MFCRINLADAFRSAPAARMKLGSSTHFISVCAILVCLASLRAAEVPTRPQPAWGDLGDGTYRNPILWADYNNPCVFKAGDEFFLTAASHHYMGMPLLKSKDLVNWTHAGRIYSRLGGLHADFTHPGAAYSAGSQDGEVGFHRGTYYMFNWSTRYRGFFCTAPSPLGPWTAPRKITESLGGNFEDPCPFWDDDGSGYLLLVGNPGPLKIFRLNATFDTIVDQGTTLITDIPPKGPQIFKRHGFYYLSVASTGKNSEKAQHIYRSKSLFGPFERRTIFHSGRPDFNGAQGSLVHVAGEQWAFLHHDYNLTAPYGRRIYLQPAGWSADDWPWIGVDTDGDGIGESVGIDVPYAKPPLPRQPINPADPSDEFSATTLGGQWAWNHDPDDAQWSLTARPGWLGLTARPLHTQGGVSQLGRTKVNYHADHLLFAANTLVQRPCGAISDIVTRLDTAQLSDGQRAGLCTLSDDYTWIGVVREGGVKRIRFAKGQATSGQTASLDGPELRQNEVWLKLEYRHYRGTLSYSLDGVRYEPLGDRDYPYRTAWYEGTKVGLFSYTVSSEVAGGRADFDFLRQTHDGPKPTRTP